MSETIFTPGPWSADDAVKFFGVSDGTIGVRNSCNQYLVACHYGVPIRFAEAQANAHLIAAAPDLYEALYNVMLEFGPGTMSEATFSGACAALAKARGGQP